MVKAKIGPKDLDSLSDEEDATEGSSSILSKIRSLLFSLADKKPDQDSTTGEFLIQIEALKVVSVGFTILFPSPVDQAMFLAEILNKSNK